MDVDVGREERHLAFGAGPHFCIGAPVARAQLPILVKAWLKRIPDFRIAEGANLTAHFGDVFGLDSLPLVWN
jgi:cytochrome P450